MRNSDWSKDNHRSKKKTVKALGRLFKYMSQHYFGVMIIVLAATFFSTFAGVRGALFLQTVVDDFVLPALGTVIMDASGITILETPGVFDAAGMIREIMVMALIYAGGAVATFLLYFLMVRVSGGIQRMIRDDLFKKMQTLPINYFDGQLHGDLMSKVTHDVDAMRGMLSQSLPEIIRALFTLVVTFVGMVMLSLSLTAVVVVAVLIQVCMAKWVTGKSKAGFISSAKAMGEMNGYIEEMLAGHKVVKVFAQEEKVKAEFDLLNEELTDHLRTANRFSNMLFPLLIAMGQALYGFIALVGGILVLNPNSALTVGAVASFLYLSRTFVHPIGQISVQINAIIKALAASDRIFDTLDEASEIDEGTVTLEQSKGHVVFKDVTFGYQDETLVLRGISFEAKPGQKVAIIGKTGAGKTTISNLVSRFYDIRSGQITLDGHDIQTLTKTSLRQHMGMVLQDTRLFTGTIADNIKYGRPDATRNEIKLAAKLARAHDFIERLPKGYDTVITDNGGSLSVGQCQLLGIARVLMMEPAVVVLDEATANVDTLTEARVQEGFKVLMESRTSLVIAHRLSTIKDADLILVVDKGQIIEQGTHEGLLATGGSYASMYQKSVG
ncbi:MAG: ABC transporter ATP-binding protein/permease [Defluviitaleaceae bacterium]|nr:ABC transporter ATP-binding protein/permease [Defluviitaleaceae bacterium]